MIVRILLFLLSLNALTLSADSSLAESVPVLYNGRFRPMDAYARLRLYDLYHRETLRDAEKQDLESVSPLDLLWKLHFQGPEAFKDLALVWVAQASSKSSLGLPTRQDRFSVTELEAGLRTIGEDQMTDDLRQIRARISSLSIPSDSYLNEYQELRLRGVPAKGISESLDNRFSIYQRLRDAGDDFQILPSQIKEGEWFSLRSLSLEVYNIKTDSLEPIPNFTSYSDESFNKIQASYLTLKQAVAEGKSSEIQKQADALLSEINQQYQELAGRPYQQSLSKALYYPSIQQLQWESFYYRVPLTLVACALYTLAAILLALSLSSHQRAIQLAAFASLAIAFLVHTAVLALRCYILQRPPVSNMFETVLYVPWVTVLAGFTLRTYIRHNLSLLLAAVSAVTLLLILHVAKLDHAMENVQAVLDSQYWLTVHVLMVVGSYGVYVLCGILGHAYLMLRALGRLDEETAETLSRLTIQSMYLGTALLIPATILGGVWAAQSWGRFWDWDPKESWAFISACIYVIWIHAYTFRHIRELGLAIGAVTGLIAISFTWYGVNYILGTGLHSYGFGNGGEVYYYAYILAELLFLGWTVRPSLKTS